MRVQSGDTVRVQYTGTLDDGTLFDTSVGKEPLKFAVGWGEVIGGFDKAVIGMVPGESKKVRIPKENAYGLYDDSLVGLVDRDSFSPDMELKQGLIVKIDLPDSKATVVTVIDVSDSSVTLDANHPLAGLDLNFDIELLEIM